MSTTAQPFTLAGIEIRPGSTERIGLPVARLITQQVVEVPVVVVHGAEPGPVVWVSSAIHGDEIHGVEIIRRVQRRVRADKLRGTLLLIPVVNVLGFVQQSRYLPDRRDLNRSFPGSPRGSLASQIAHLLMTEIVDRSDYGIDLHAGSHHRTNVPQARGDLSDPRTLALCQAFGAPIVVGTALRSGSLRHAAALRGIPCVLYEAGEPLRFEPEAVAAGVRGVLRVLAHLEMIGSAPHLETPSRVARSSRWVRATRSGLLHLDVASGDEVLEGDTLAVIRDTYGDIATRMRAAHGGVVIGHTLNPLVNRGDAVLHVATVDETT